MTPEMEILVPIGFMITMAVLAVLFLKWLRWREERRQRRMARSELEAMSRRNNAEREKRYAELERTLQTPSQQP